MLRTKDVAYNSRVYTLQNYLYKRCQSHPLENSLKEQINVYIMDMILNGAKLEYDYIFDKSICHQYIFPFKWIDKNSRIILYGAGNVGSAYYKQVKKSGYCEIIGWVDSNAGEKNIKLDKIMSPQVITDLEFDSIVIAILDEDVAREIQDQIQQLGVCKDKIIWKSPLGCF